MSEKANRSRRSPQEKKTLSYERDCVNTYGQNDKASRKAIPRFKARSHREARHAAAAAVHNVAFEGGDEERWDVALFRAGHRPAPRKVRDAALGLTLDERPLTRIGGADRVPTRNRRDSVRALFALRGKYEARDYLTLAKREDKE